MGKTVFQLSPDGGTTKYDLRDSNIAPIELNPAHASQPYAVNEEFVLDADGLLYEATSPISQGSAIIVYPTIGYNCKLSDSVTGQIRAIKDSLGTASAKNSTSVVTQSTDLVESGAVYSALAEKEATADFTENGNPIVIDNGYDAYVKGLKVTLEPIQSGSGTPSPDNIRAISGRTETTVTARNEDSTDIHTVTISLGQIIYGGTVDFITGVIKVGWKMATQWAQHPTYSHVFYNSQHDNKEFPYTVIATAKSNALPTVQVSGLAELNNLDYGLRVTDYVYAENKDCTTIEQWNQFITNVGLQVCYELASPITITLTPQQLKLLKGYNYIAADGNINLDYVGTVKEWIEEELDKLDGEKADNSVIGTVEDGSTASQAYAVGSHAIRNGAFITWKNAKAQGEPINDASDYTSGDVATQFGLYIPIANNAGFHNSIFRGKNLGSSLTTAQKNTIAAGTFDDMFIGDYWEINGIKWRIAHFDYWHRSGDTQCTTHHVVVVPDNVLNYNIMNDKVDNKDVTTGAYINSKMYQSQIADARNIVKTAFGENNILTHREWFANATNVGGWETGGAWYDSQIDLMNEIMVYGSNIFHNCVNGTSWPGGNYTIDKVQLALFRLDQSYTIALNPAGTDRASWWLRDVCSATNFACASGYGNAYYNGASASSGVRPAFGIK